MLKLVLFAVMWVGGFLVGWGGHGVVLSHKTAVENCHVIQQPQELHCVRLRASVIECDTIKAKVHYIIHE